MKARMALTVVLVLMLACVTIGNVSADANTPQTAARLYNKMAASGTLVGNRGGAFWYAYVDSPGNGNVITIRMSFYPADPVTSRGVGYNLYGPFNGQLIGSGRVGDDTEGGIPNLQYAGDKPERLLLQVYNYAEGVELHFTVTAEGVSSLPVAAVAPTTGALAGGGAGAFARYWFTFSSAEPVTLVMLYSPADQLISRGVSFKIYGPDGEVAVEKTETGPYGRVEATFIPAVGVRYLVQAENYIQGIAVSFNFQSSIKPASVTPAA